MSNAPTSAPFAIFEQFKSLIHTTANYTYYAYYGGRGGGKSENVAACLILISTMAVHRILCVREIQSSIGESVKALLEGKIEAMGLSHLFEITRDEIRCVNGSVFMFRGLRTSNAANIKSIFQVTFSWVEESETLSQESLNLLLPSVLRTPGAKIIFTFNPRYEDDPVYKMFISQKPPPKSKIVKINHDANPFFKASGLEEQRIHDLEVLPRSEYLHKWEGELRKLSENSLFNERDVELARMPDMPELGEFSKIVIACDPATTHKDYSNEYGICVCAMRKNGEFWLLANHSKVHTPSSFADEVDLLWSRWGAAAVVVETNQGGDFIKSTLLQKNPRLNIIEVRASKDKIHRASPIANMMALGKIKLLDTERSNAKHLIRQMANVTTQGYIGPKGSSPDALDAFVWGIYELANLSEKDTEATLFDLRWLDPQKGFDFRSHQCSAFICCDNSHFVAIEFKIAENNSLQRRLIVEHCTSDDLANLQEYVMDMRYESVWLCEREAFYNIHSANLVFYDDAYEDKDLDHLALQTCNVLRQHLVASEITRDAKYKDAYGNILHIFLSRFKLEQKQECLITKTLCLLVRETL